MKLRRTRLGGAIILAVGLGLPAWWYGWFAGEPVYHGRTVTGWLDHMAVFDPLRDQDQTHKHGFRFRLSPQVVTNDPALRALLKLGSRAVPTLIGRVKQQPFVEPPIFARLALLAPTSPWMW